MYILYLYYQTYLSVFRKSVSPHQKESKPQTKISLHNVSLLICKEVSSTRNQLNYNECLRYQIKF